MNIGIAGLGLIGGSMAKAIKKYTWHQVYGFDTNEAVMRQALADGNIDGVLDAETLSDCDILLPALYPGAAVSYIKDSIPFMKKGLIIVDLCGVKKAVMYPVEALELPAGVLYFGGHPMAGLEKSGYAYSKADLFRNASMIIVPVRKGDAKEENSGLTGQGENPGQTAQEEALKLIEGFFLSLGFSGITLTSAEEHDRVIAFTSQLAHVVSSAYVKSPTALKHYGFSAGSYKDLTRVARLNEEMWTELFLDNADSLTEEIDCIIRHLVEYRDAISERRRPELKELLKEGRERKEHIDTFENS